METANILILKSRCNITEQNFQIKRSTDRHKKPLLLWCVDEVTIQDKSTCAEKLAGISLRS